VLFTSFIEVTLAGHKAFRSFPPHPLALPDPLGRNEKNNDPLGRNALADVVWGMSFNSQVLLAAMFSSIALWPWHYCVGDRYYQGFPVKGNFVWDKFGFAVGRNVVVVVPSAYPARSLHLACG
jgi:hypothetical protein